MTGQLLICRCDPFFKQQKRKKHLCKDKHFNSLPDCKPFLILMTELRLFFPKQI